MAVGLNIDSQYMAMIVAYFAAILNRLYIDTWLLDVCVRVPSSFSWSFPRFCQSFSKHSLAVGNRTNMASNNLKRRFQHKNVKNIRRKICYVMSVKVIFYSLIISWRIECHNLNLILLVDRWMLRHFGDHQDVIFTWIL